MRLPENRIFTRSPLRESSLGRLQGTGYRGQSRIGDREQVIENGQRKGVGSVSKR